MTVTHVSQRAAVSAPSGVDQVAREVSAVTRLLEAEGILDYSGHVSARIPGREAFVIQIGSTSRGSGARVDAGRRPRRQGDRGRGPASKRAPDPSRNSQKPPR